MTTDALLTVDSELFRALAEPIRVEILSCLLLAGGSARVGDLAAQFDIDQSGVSRHLQELERAGVVRSTRRGRERIISMEVDALIQVFSSLVDQLQRIKRGLPCC